MNDVLGKNFNIEDLSEEDQEAINMIREIFVQVGFAIASSIRYSKAPGALERTNILKAEWMKLANQVVEFAIQD
jgi:hypothetical protein